ncbi:cytochrome b/b6 domain-containing protein [Candidatus Desantisbacteria bacterium]|nr:cytochrome b/b6 domain-containing protein [Candidatus Desantisbacteria bacterium]
MKQYIRLTLNQRIQHIILIISFLTLVATGLPVRYHDTTWARFLINLFGGFEMRGIIHRTAGVIMIISFIYHCFYIAYLRIIIHKPLTLLPDFKDAKDVFHNLGYFLGIVKHPPMFDHFNYIEKAEYLALIWGTIVMILTGLILWFPGKAIYFLPNVAFDISTVLHSCEALLAFLAILVWHFYYAHLNPHVFPMSKVWLTGRISEEDMKEEHALEYERLM